MDLAWFEFSHLLYVNWAVAILTHERLTFIQKVYCLTSRNRIHFGTLGKSLIARTIIEVTLESLYQPRYDLLVHLIYNPIHFNATFIVLNLRLMRDSKVLHPCHIDFHSPLTICLRVVGGNLSARRRPTLKSWSSTIPHISYYPCIIHSYHLQKCCFCSFYK